jgi:hypothetical protein
VVEGDCRIAPEALKKNENFTNRLKLDPEIKCYLPACRAILHAVSVQYQNRSTS